MPTFHLLNFGCRANQADGAALKLELLNAGFAEAEDPAQSDIAVLNTCTVTAAADAEVRQVIRRVHRVNSRCRVLVTGCYAQRAPEDLCQLDGVAWVVGNSHKHQLAEILKTHFSSPEDRFPTPSLREKAETDPHERELRTEAWVEAVGPEFHFLPVFPDDRTRPTLKVQDGCNARCSFCIIPAVRGRSRSLSPERVIPAVRQLEGNGYKEIVLSGINLGSYGRDLAPRSSFLELVERILAETRIPRLRISSIEPMDVSPELIRLATSTPRVAEHWHVPLQSGSNRILRQMNRRYWTAQYAERILAIHEALPNAGIGADVMTGFPGETNEDHGASVRFIESLPFTYLHVFPFSPRPSTAAAARADQLNGRIAHERGAALRAIVAEKRRSFLAAQVGRLVTALTLNEPRAGESVAMTSNYLNVVLPGAPMGSNQLIPIRVRCVDKDQLYGEIPKEHET
ncbi:MAG: tRNA (N(6)-L-threonylcarbamoyladenosine(37)-C(2))-methylthiotransferase MtaB [Terriglobia bacterium]